MEAAVKRDPNQPIRGYDIFVKVRASRTSLAPITSASNRSRPESTSHALSGRQRVYAHFSVADSIGTVIVHRAYTIRGSRLIHSSVDDNIFSTRAASIHTAPARGIVFSYDGIIRR
ncbi:hypothetical protein MTO96_044620 [Rhipicephalus appendiculatus]